MSNLSAKYPPGKKFRVVREGAYLSGWTAGSSPGSFHGWRKDLHAGEVVETLGYGRDMGSDPGYGIHFKADAAFVEFKPSQGSAFDFEPADGYLEPIEEEGGK